MAKRVTVKISESGFTKEHEKQLEVMRATLETVRQDIKMLEAAKKHRVDPSQLMVLVEKAHKKQAAHIQRLTARVETLGGAVRAIGKTKFSTGYAEDWKYYIPVNDHFGIGFEMNRILDPMEFDQPIAFIPHLLRVKKGQHRLDTKTGFRDSFEHERLYNGDWMECATMAQFNKQIVRLSKMANELAAEMTAPTKTKKK